MTTSPSTNVTEPRVNSFSNSSPSNEMMVLASRLEPTETIQLNVSAARVAWVEPDIEHSPIEVRPHAIGGLTRTNYENESYSTHQTINPVSPMIQTAVTELDIEDFSTPRLDSPPPGHSTGSSPPVFGYEGTSGLVRMARELVHNNDLRENPQTLTRIAHLAEQDLMRWSDVSFNEPRNVPNPLSSLGALALADPTCAYTSWETVNALITASKDIEAQMNGYDSWEEPRR